MMTTPTKTRTRCLRLALALTLVAASIVAMPASACHDGSPLILDLNGDGILTTDEAHPVRFDIDADGVMDSMGWTFWESREGFLAVDLNGNGRIDDGTELFGDATILPTGEEAENGFEALAVYDRPELGGTGDGVITETDLIWNDLRLWVDANHDGVSQPNEMRRLRQYGVRAIGLDYSQTDAQDGAGNYHRYTGMYIKEVRRYGQRFLETARATDVFFRIFHEH